MSAEDAEVTRILNAASAGGPAGGRAADACAFEVGREMETDQWRRITIAPVLELQWLAINDGRGQWHWADGTIDDPELLVSAKGVDRPVAVRYAYTTQPRGNLLYNGDGMPVGPFTTCWYDDHTDPDR